ncbi:MAG: hypothetical protein K2N31_09295, partial [Treponemataceae bacterium]|nr:hypothetical protein [Treponemataceae bacterium]
MKKLIFAATCAALLTSCASTPSGTATAAKPIAGAITDMPENAPPADDEIIVAESTDDTQAAAPADESRADDGQASGDETARAETMPDETAAQKIEAIAAGETHDAQT